MLTFFGFIILLIVAFFGFCIVASVIACVCEGVNAVVEFFSPEKKYVPAPVPCVVHEQESNTPKTRGRKKTKTPPVNEYVLVGDREESFLNTGSSTKEYVLPDGSKFTVDESVTTVTEKNVTEAVVPTRSPAERFGGGMAEIIRKRREAEVF